MLGSHLLLKAGLSLSGFMTSDLVHPYIKCPFLVWHCPKSQVHRVIIWKNTAYTTHTQERVKS
jgi:hypothetical protein